MEREQGAQKRQMVTVESSEVRRNGDCGEKAKKGGKRSKSKKGEKNSIKSNSKKGMKRKSEWKKGCSKYETKSRPR